MWIIERLKQYDFLMLFGVVVLIAIGLVMLYTATSGEEGNPQHLFERQLIYALAGVVLMITVAAISPRVHFTFAYLFYIFCCLLLLGVLVWGDSSKGAARWIDLKLFSFQPSEPAKIALIMVLARHVTDKRYNPWKIAHLLRTVILSLIPLLLVMAQPDLGTSIVFAAISLTAIIAAGTPLLYLLVLLSPLFAALAAINTYVMLGYFILLVVVAWRLQLRLGLLILLVLGNLSISLAAPQIWNQLKPYQKNRLVSFFDPEVDPQGSGYQVIQSKVAIGSGGSYGKGLGEGSQTQLKFLPEQHTDFIFSVVGEELGFAGATVVLLLLLLVIGRGYHAALRSKGQYSALVCLGLSAVIMVHVVINISMTVGLMPVTGLPLPFLSYGGSFLWTVMIAMGLILGIQRRWKEYTP